MSFPFSHRDFFRVMLVAALTLITGLFTYDLWVAANWNTNPAYGGDALEILARVQLAAEQDFSSWLGQPLTRLGAPFDTSWAAYPQPDQLILWVAGQLSRSIGLIAASHVMMLFAHVTSAASFFLCARSLGHRPLWAGCCAVLFGLCHFSIFRGLTHFSFTLTFLLPPMILTAWWVGTSRRFQLTAKNVLLGSLFTLLVGSSNPYYVFVFLQLLAGAVFFQFFTRKQTQNLLGGMGLILGTIVSVIIWNAPTLWAFGQHTADPLVRSYAGTELYALKLIELFVPPTSHHFPIFADFGRYYGGSTSIRGELHSAYVGLIPAIALMLIAVHGLKKLLAGRASLRPSHGSWAIWFILFGGVGGLQSWLALAGLNYFRASNRYSVVLVTLSLYFLCSFLSRVPWLQNRKAVSWVFALAITGVGLWDQIPPHAPLSVKQTVVETIRRDTAFAAFLEKNLPQQAQIFQLPSSAFPEQPTIVGMKDYAHFRPFLFTHTLRFSYGSLVGTAEANWARWVGTLRAAELIATLQASGFDALCINRTGYKDRATELLTEITASGYSVLTAPEANPEYAVIRLQPAPAVSHRAPNLADPRLLKPWYREKSSPPGQPEIYATRGWFGAEQSEENTWRWAGRDAAATLRNPGQVSRKARIQFEFASNKPGRLTLRQQDRSLWTAPASISLAESGELSIELPPGTTELNWSYEGPIVRPATGDNRKLGFKIQNLRVTFTD